MMFLGLVLAIVLGLWYVGHDPKTSRAGETVGYAVFVVIYLAALALCLWAAVAVIHFLWRMT